MLKPCNSDMQFKLVICYHNYELLANLVLVRNTYARPGAKVEYCAVALLLINLSC